ncbi:MAG: NUMOD4 domain-containing protein [Actinomycetota bacterium]|nr:NUMOD4 domain-containing protein [Actinomycetota bacterium]
MNDDERWLPINGWENYYEVSNHGRVRSLARTVTQRGGRRYRVRERILKPQQVRPGSDMAKVFLSYGGRGHCKLIHLLVAEAFGEQEIAA